MQTPIINFIFLISHVHLYLSASSPEWIGTYEINNSCNQEECCCVAEQAIITKASDTELLVTANVAGVPCQEQLNGSTTVGVLFPIPQDKNGYQITMNFLGTDNRFTLSADSQYIANVNLQYPKCSGMAQRVSSNWLGTFSMDDSCNQNECCCLSGQATINKLGDTQFLMAVPVAGEPCQTQLNGSTSIEILLPFPQDKHGFQITTDFFGALHRFTLTYDNQYIAHANLQYPKCSGTGQRTDGGKSTGSLISSTSIFLLINTFLFQMLRM